MASRGVVARPRNSELVRKVGTSNTFRPSKIEANSTRLPRPKVEIRPTPVGSTKKAGRNSAGKAVFDGASVATRVRHRDIATGVREEKATGVPDLRSYTKVERKFPIKGGEKTAQQTRHGSFREQLQSVRKPARSRKTKTSKPQRPKEIRTANERSTSGARDELRKAQDRSLRVKRRFSEQQGSAGKPLRNFQAGRLGPHQPKMGAQLGQGQRTHSESTQSKKVWGRSANGKAVDTTRRPRFRHRLREGLQSGSTVPKDGKVPEVPGPVLGSAGSNQEAKHRNTGRGRDLLSQQRNHVTYWNPGASNSGTHCQENCFRKECSW